MSSDTQNTKIKIEPTDFVETIHDEITIKEEFIKTEFDPIEYSSTSKNYVFVRGNFGEENVQKLIKYYKCKHCDEKFQYLNVLAMHEEKHADALTCGICQKVFKYQSKLITHERTHTGERPFVCAICNKAFKIQGHLTVHQRTHSDDRPFECEICERTFIQKGDLKAHERTHTGERPFVCEVCDKTFTRNGYLRKHQRTHHATDKS